MFVSPTVSHPQTILFVLKGHGNLGCPPALWETWVVPHVVPKPTVAYQSYCHLFMLSCTGVILDMYQNSWLVCLEPFAEQAEPKTTHTHTHTLHQRPAPGRSFASPLCPMDGNPGFTNLWSLWLIGKGGLGISLGPSPCLNMNHSPLNSPLVS